MELTACSADGSVHFCIGYPMGGAQTDNYISPFHWQPNQPPCVRQCLKLSPLSKKVCRVPLREGCFHSIQQLETSWNILNEQRAQSRMLSQMHILIQTVHWLVITLVPVHLGSSLSQEHTWTRHVTCTFAQQHSSRVLKYMKMATLQTPSNLRNTMASTDHTW